MLMSFRHLMNGRTVQYEVAIEQVTAAPPHRSSLDRYRCGNMHTVSSEHWRREFRDVFRQRNHRADAGRRQADLHAADRPRRGQPLLRLHRRARPAPSSTSSRRRCSASRWRSRPSRATRSAGSTGSSPSSGWSRSRSGLAHYEVVLRPWLWLLGLTTDCRIFQNLSVVEIIEEIFGKYPDGQVREAAAGDLSAARILRAVRRDRPRLRAAAAGARGHLLFLRVRRGRPHAGADRRDGQAEAGRGLRHGALPRRGRRRRGATATSCRTGSVDQLAAGPAPTPTPTTTSRSRACR